MYPWSLLFVDVRNLVQSTVAHQSAMRERHVGLFANYRRLNLHDLSHVVGAGFEFVSFDAVVNADKNILIYVPAVIDAPKIFDKVLQAHTTLGFEVWRVQVGVEHYDCKRKDEHCVRGTQSGHDVGITLAVALAENFHQSLDLLSLAGHSEVRLELSQGNVDLHPRQVQLVREALEHRHIKRALKVAQVLADHLL